MWQIVDALRTNKNVPEKVLYDLARAMSEVRTYNFPLTRGQTTSNWIGAVKTLQRLLRKEIDECQQLLKSVLSDSNVLTVAELDERVISRVNTLTSIVDKYIDGKLDSDVGFTLSRSFEAYRREVLSLREETAKNDELRRHENALHAVVSKGARNVSMLVVIEAWGHYQAFRENKHKVVPVALEKAAKLLLNDVIHSHLRDANTILRDAILTRNADVVRDAVKESEALTALLFNNSLYEMVMPDIHVVIPGFAHNRKKAREIVMRADFKRSKKTKLTYKSCLSL